MARISTPDSDDQTNQSLIMRPIKAQAYVLPKHILSVWKRCGDREVLFYLQSPAVTIAAQYLSTHLNTAAIIERKKSDFGEISSKHHVSSSPHFFGSNVCVLMIL